jgi:hypothetical protein
MDWVLTSNDRHSANGMRRLGRPVTGLGKLAT